MKLVGRLWLPMVIAAVVAVGGFMVHRVHGYFGAHTNDGGSSIVFEDTKPFHPKVVTYEVSSPEGTVADINYLDVDAQPKRVDAARLPWSLTLSTTDPAVSLIVIAQGQSDTIGCRITVDSVVKDEGTSNGVNAQTFCLVKAA